MFGLVHNHRLVFRRSFEVGGDATAFAFTAEGGALGAQAGQHMVVAATASLRKPFSLASAPEEELVLIGTSLRSGSAFKRRLAALTEGEAISARGPIFTYFKPFGIDTASEGRAVMLAQGVGVTPFRSMLGHLAHRGRPHDTHLIHVSRAGHPFREDTERWATATTFVDRAVDFRDAADAAVDADGTRLFYVAGAPRFVSETKALLRRRGVSRRRIRDDPYLFYTAPDTTARRD